RVEAHGVGEVLDKVREEARSQDDRAEGDDRLGQDEPEGWRGRQEANAGPTEQRREGELVERLALLELLLDVLGSASSFAQDEEEVEKVRRDEDPAEIRLDEVGLRGNERERECDGVHDKEEGEIPQGVRRVDVERVALAARDGAATTGANGAHEGDEDEDERTEHQEGGERAVEEVERAAVARDQRLAQLALRRVAEHERDDQRRQWVLQLPQPVANEAED